MYPDFWAQTDEIQDLKCTCTFDLTIANALKLFYFVISAVNLFCFFYNTVN